MSERQTPEEAMISLSRAVENRPGDAAAHHNLGRALARLRRFDQALTSYQCVISIQPDNVEAHCDLGAALRSLGRLEAALMSYDCALSLKPGIPEIHTNRGNLLRDLGRPDAALASYERALQIKPASAKAWSNRGVVLHQLKRIVEALQSYDRALQIDSQFAEAHNNRGIALDQLLRTEEALASFRRALAINPAYPGAHKNLGHALQRMGRLEEALDSLDRALALNPEYIEAYNDRAGILRRLCRFAEALVSFEQALRFNQDHAVTYNNRGVLYYEQIELQPALLDYERALVLRPDYPEAHQNRAYALLLGGDFANGWIEHEWRLRGDDTPISRALRQCEKPIWMGDQSVTGKTILLRSEQGLGDMLQFSRFATRVARLAATVVLEVPSPLASLLATVEGVDRVVVSGEPLPDFDYHCALMSLPLAFGTTLSTIPNKVPYLRCDAGKNSYWSEKLGASARLRVGLVWSGGFRPEHPELWDVNRRRNIPLLKLAELRHAEIEFFSLQKGFPAETELEEVLSNGWCGPELINYTGELHDFSDSAALVNNLDLVISVDTSIAHLAGALGKPVWILNRYDSCWRWLLDRTDSPWYPTARIYRQRSAGDWEGVVQRVRDDLFALAAQRTRGGLSPGP